METTIQQTSVPGAVYTPIVRQAVPEIMPVPIFQQSPMESSPRAFIEANTKEVTLQHLTEDCIIPVFSKDNEVTISHQTFIDTVVDAAYQVFPHEEIATPAIRVSHVVKGRIPEAIHKPVNQLLESDKTIYYERMMFCVEIPTIFEDIDGSRLSLTVGGVRAYNEQNLYAKKSPEKFKIFIGFKNMVCCNLCVSTDGYKSSLRVMDASALLAAAIELFRGYDMVRHMALMSAYRNLAISESQFAQLLGKCRLYQYLPSARKKEIPELLMTDTQIGIVAKSFFDDRHFGIGDASALSLWKLFNLFTGSNKISYIDNFLDRAKNATDVTTGLAMALRGDARYAWFLQ